MTSLGKKCITIHMQQTKEYFIHLNQVLILINTKRILRSLTENAYADRVLKRSKLTKNCLANREQP